MTLLQLKYLVDDLVEKNGDAPLHIAAAPIFIEELSQKETDIFLEKYFYELDNIQIVLWKEVNSGENEYYTIYLQNLDSKIERVNQC